MIRVRVNFFSAHREAAGRGQTEIEVKEGMDLKSLLDIIFDTYPEMRKLAGYTVLSLNHRYADGSEVLGEGDEVAVFPPVEGG